MNNIIPPRSLSEQRLAAFLADVDMREFLTFALDLAADQMASRGDEFNDDDEAALANLRRIANGEPTVPPVVDRETACHVLHMFGHDGGYPPGDYMGTVYTLIARSDVQNAARLAMAFPAQAEAVRMASYDEDGIAKLTTIAAGGVL